MPTSFDNAELPQITLKELPARVKDIPRVFDAFDKQLGAIMRAVQTLDVDRNVIILTIPDGYDYHKQKIQENRKIIEKVLGKWVGQPVSVYGIWEQLASPTQPLLKSNTVPGQASSAQTTNLTNELARLQAKVNQKEAELSTFETNIARAAQERADIEALLEQITRKKLALFAEIESLHKQKEELENHLQLRKTILSQIDFQIQNNQAQKIHLEAQITQLQNQSSILQVENQEATQKQAELQSYLIELQHELDGFIELQEQKLADVQNQLAPLEAELRDRQQHIDRANVVLHAIQLQIGQPLWQAALRANLDTGELPAHLDWVLNSLEKTAPEATHAFRLEIAARTTKTVVPKGKATTGEARLFTSVIQARRAAQAGKTTAALEHLCAGWEAMLPDNAPLVAQEPAAPSPVEITAPAPQDGLPTSPLPTQTLPRHTEVLVSGAWSTLILQLNNTVIVIDPGGENYVLPDVPPDMIIVTHAHYDHVQHLPALHQKFPEVPIVMTPETNHLMALTFEAWKSAQGKVQPLPFGKSLPCANNTQITLHPAGHLLGAAMVEIMSDMHILVTGDFSWRNVGGLDRASPAVFQQAYDFVFMEAVHAFDDTFPTSDLRYDRQTRLVDRLNDAITSGYTRILIFAAALGDAQEVYHALQEARQIPDTPLRQYAVYLKGLARTVAQCYVQAGVWSAALPEEPADFPTHSIVICRKEDARDWQRQLEQTQYGVIFEPYKSAESSVSTEQNRRYQVDLHAGLKELEMVGKHIQCNILGLYHQQTTGSPLEKTLRAAGRQFVNVASADLIRLEFK